MLNVDFLVNGQRSTVNRHENVERWTVNDERGKESKESEERWTMNGEWEV